MNISTVKILLGWSLNEESVFDQLNFDFLMLYKTANVLASMLSNCGTSLFKPVDQSDIVLLRIFLVTWWGLLANVSQQLLVEFWILQSFKELFWVIYQLIVDQFYNHCLLTQLMNILIIILFVSILLRVQNLWFFKDSVKNFSSKHKLPWLRFFFLLLLAFTFWGFWLFNL